MYNLANCILFIVLVNQCILYSVVIAIHWDHSIYLNDDYRLLWSTKDQEITFEVQVKTLGYFGLGFSKDGKRYGSDIVIGWVDQGQTYFHDRHIKKYGDYEPYVDPSQDYTLLLGYENATHTVMRFKRKLDTCDTSHDIPITNDTSRIIYMYHNDEPRHGSIAPGNLPNPQLAFKGYKPLSLIQRFYDEPRNFSANKLHIIELRNQNFELPQSDESVHWCRSFDLFKQFKKKHHLIKFEPVFQSRQHENYIQHIILYECQAVIPSAIAYDMKLFEKGQLCDTPPMLCDAIVAAWYKGSEGLIFPQDVGFPIDAPTERYYLMETHYNNPNNFKDIEQLHLGPIVDNSGIRLYITENLRKHDAGVLSIGMDPNWRHIIPPGHEKVISEGHCIDDCTKKAFPPQGISIFAVIMQTHNIGKEVKLRQLRRHEELLPIVTDENIHSQYTEYHKIRPPAKILPGDRMIMECKYNSSMRSAITLGGLQLREERCIALAIYYPRQKRLTTCHSIPSLNTVLHSLGIEKLSMDSQPVRIALPPELSGMLLETRLLSYDWANQFDVFQKVTKSGSFHVVCRDAKGDDLLGNNAVERYSLSPIKVWRSIISNNCNSKITTQLYRIESADLTTLHDYRNIYVTEMVQQNQISDSNSDVESLGLSNNVNRLAIIRISSSNKFYTLCYILIYLITWYTI